MCGIFFSCCKDDYIVPDESLQHNLVKRGPDHCNTITRKVEGSGEKSATYMTFFATVLSLRGDHIVQQPLVDPASSSVLCWNGEAWKIDGRQIEANDAEAVFDFLLTNTRPRIIESSTQNPVEGLVDSQIAQLFSRITGPYAFLYYDAPNARVYYGRDVLGRRSLLINKNWEESIVISSNCSRDPAHEWAEVEAEGIYRLDLDAGGSHFVPTADTKAPGDRYSVSSPQLPLQNIAFRPQLVMPKFQQLSTLNKSLPHASEQIPGTSPSVVNNLAEFLEASLRIRVEHIPLRPCAQDESPRLAILFSGGLDCTVLARMVHDIVPRHQEVDLLNVAFENPRVNDAAARRGHKHDISQSPYASCPDRITGTSSHQELVRICPQRRWRLVCIDIPYTETLKHRPQIISLIRPHNTEMDLSIACALYFAARGEGHIYDHATSMTKSYTTPARVLLSGLGADEIFGGYQRHAMAFYRGGHSALITELELDISRLGRRNLGRDDRVLSHWGREVRYPYLDECFVTWALGLPVWEKCGFGVPVNTAQGPDDGTEPGKRLLRLLAQRMGMQCAASEKKRAIQFGARTAKMEIGKIKGTQLLI